MNEPERSYQEDTNKAEQRETPATRTVGKGGTVIPEEDLRRAVWEGCHGVKAGTTGASQIEAQGRQAGRRKRHKRRYSFPRRGFREKQERLCRRLFPWNRFRSHL